MATKTKTKSAAKKETIPEGYANWKEMALSYKNDLTELPIPVMKIDTEFTITYLNRAGAEFVGRTVDDVVGTKCYDLFQSRHCKASECCCSKAMLNDDVFTAENVADPGGRNIPFRYTARPLKNADGRSSAPSSISSTRRK